MREHNFRLISKDSCFTCQNTYFIKKHTPFVESRGICKKGHFDEVTKEHMACHICDMYKKRKANDEN